MTPLRISTDQYPPFITTSCFSNGSNMNSIKAGCNLGVELYILTLLMKQRNISGTLLELKHFNDPVDAVIAGDADISGDIMSNNYFLEHHNGKVELSRPIEIGKMMFVTLALNTPRYNDRSMFLSIYSWDLWVVYVSANLVGFLSFVLLKHTGLNLDGLKAGMYWLFVIVSGLFTNLMAVELAKPFTSTAPFDSVNELVERLENKECYWYAPEAVYENTDLFSSPQRTSTDIDWDRFFLVAVKKNPLQMISNTKYNPEALIQHLISLYKRQSTVCHVLVDWASSKPIYQILESKYALDLKFITLQTNSYYGYFFRKDLPNRMKDSINIATSIQGMNNFYITLLQRQLQSEIKHNRDFGDEPAVQPYTKIKMIHLKNLFLFFLLLAFFSTLYFLFGEIVRSYVNFSTSIVFSGKPSQDPEVSKLPPKSRWKSSWSLTLAIRKFSKAQPKLN